VRLDDLDDDARVRRVAALALHADVRHRARRFEVVDRRERASDDDASPRRTRRSSRPTDRPHTRVFRTVAA
jgi:hypothetical protein